MKTLLERGDYPAFATHDPAMHALAKQWAAERGIGLDRYEFQLLYGVRRDLQTSLVAQGHRVRDLHPVRTRVVSVLHAPPRRAAGQHRVGRAAAVRDESGVERTNVNAERRTQSCAVQTFSVLSVSTLLRLV